jgi:hypothetical protein
MPEESWGCIAHGQEDKDCGQQTLVLDPVSSMAYSSILKIKGAGSFKMVNIYQITQGHISEASSLLGSLSCSSLPEPQGGAQIT